MTPAPNRGWFRCSMLVLFVVATPFACWLGYELTWLWQRRQAIAHTIAHASTTVNASGNPDQRLAPSWLSLFGEPGYVEVVVKIPYRRRISRQAVIDRMLELFPEADIVVMEPESNSEPAPKDIDGFKVSAAASTQS